MSGPDCNVRARGVLLGLACGDALGAPVEFDSRHAIAQRFPEGLRDFTSGGWLNVVPGELTDDSRMAIDLAEILAVPGEPDYPALGQRFVAWMNEQPKDIGNTTRLAIQHLASEVAWDRAGYLALETRGIKGASSNGSLMRTAPVALRYFRDPARLVDVARSTSRITHAEDRCQWSCVALNQAIAHLLSTGSIAGMIEAAVAGVENAEVVATIERSESRSADDLSGSGFVLNALEIAFWAVQSTSTLEDAIVAAVMIGDDTDTNGAVTGSLAGALYGVSAIPARWLDILHERDRLESLADRLTALAG